MPLSDFTFYTDTIGGRGVVPQATSGVRVPFIALHHAVRGVGTGLPRVMVEYDGFAINEPTDIGREVTLLTVGQRPDVSGIWKIVGRGRSGTGYDMVILERIAAGAPHVNSDTLADVRGDIAFYRAQFATGSSSGTVSGGTGDPVFEIEDTVTAPGNDMDNTEAAANTAPWYVRYRPYLMVVGLIGLAYAGYHIIKKYWN